MELDGYDFTALMQIARLKEDGLSTSTRTAVNAAANGMRSTVGRDLAKILLDERTAKTPQEQAAVTAIRRAAGLDG